VHDIVDPYPGAGILLDELELSLRRLEEEMARRRAADVATRFATEILQLQSVKNPQLAAKQARLLALLKARPDRA
jgi:hypothetical protein